MARRGLRMFVVFAVICSVFSPALVCAAEKIKDLEKRLAVQEEKNAGVSALETISSPELEAKIDERINKKIPTLELLEGLDMGVSITAVLQSARNVNADTQLSAREDVTDGSY